jgi:aspartyl/asparaginyl-tRNA synthetase
MLAIPVLAQTTQKTVIKTPAKTQVVKKVVAPKPVVKKVVKPKTPTTQGFVTEVDYEQKFFTLQVKDGTYTVSTTAKTKVYVPKVKKAMDINNLSQDMEVKVLGMVDKDNKEIVAQTVTVLPTKTVVKS